MLSVAVLFYVVSTLGSLSRKTAPSQELNKYHHERRDAA